MATQVNLQFLYVNPNEDKGKELLHLIILPIYIYYAERVPWPFSYMTFH